MDLRHLTDDQLLKDTQFWVNKERESITCVLFHLKEVERRRVFSDLGYSSLFEYAVKKLGYSESSAMRRIHSARLLNEMPFLKEKIEKGKISLSNLSDAAKLFKKENVTDKKLKREVLQTIEEKSSRECERTLLQLFPSSDPLPKESIKLVSSGMHSLTYLISDSTYQKLVLLKNTLAPRVLTNDGLMDLMISLSLDEIIKKKFRLNAPSAPKAQSKTRYISSSLKKDVYNEGKGRCRKCGGTYKLEFDHTQPFSQGGLSEKENIRLLCFSCNQRSRIRAGL